MTLIGIAGMTTSYKYISSGAANQDSTIVKSTPGSIYGIQIGNNAATARFVKLYDKATAPTSSDTPIKTLEIPAATNGAGSNVPLTTAGISFNTGISFRITTGMADNDTGSASANDIVVNIDYK